MKGEKIWRRKREEEIIKDTRGQKRRRKQKGEEGRHIKKGREMG